MVVNPIGEDRFLEWSDLIRFYSRRQKTSLIESDLFSNCLSYLIRLIFLDKLKGVEDTRPVRLNPIR